MNKLIFYIKGDEKMSLSKDTEKLLIMKLLGLEANETNETNETSVFIGKKVMIRTYSAGVHFGILESKQGQNALLKDARRVHYWAKACSLSQLAMEGDKKIEDCRISVPVDLIELDQVIEVIGMTESAWKNLTSKVWKS